MGELTSTLTPVLEKLAEMFSVSVDFLQAHLMEYVLKYGKYTCVADIPCHIVRGIIISFVVFLVSSVVLAILDDCIMDFESMEKIRTKIPIAIAILTIITLTISVLWEPLLYLISPEIYSINKVLSLIKYW